MKVHLIAIAGTGMGALAGLLKAAGHDVRGSDRAVYPPMSDQLEALNIPVFEGFSPKNLDWAPDIVVVGNVCSKDHPEAAEAATRGLTLTSLPAMLGEQFLADRHSVVIAGTHGKTTTTSLTAHLLNSAGRDPGAFIGGVPLNFGRGWRLGSGDFVVEGDEYDSAYFDKGSKFLHYRPNTAVLTSVELDHVDIFSSMEAVRETFRKFVALIPADGRLICAANDTEALEIAETAACNVETYAVLTSGAPATDQSGETMTEEIRDATWQITNVSHERSGRCRFDVLRKGTIYLTGETLLSGNHNLSNIAAAVAVATARDIPVEAIRVGLATFAGVKRRQEIRGLAQGVFVIDDYAHHPTSVELTLEGLSNRFHGRRLIAVYEPRSATSRRKTFQEEFAHAFALADTAIIGKPYGLEKIPLEERFDPARLALDLHQRGTTAMYIEDTDEIAKRTADMARPGDVVVVFSSGAFDGLHGKLLTALGDAVVPARPSDMEKIRSLLDELDLDSADIGPDDHINYVVLENEDGFVGCIGLEIFGEEAVLRGLAVKPGSRGVGYGWMLADTVIAMARFRGVRRIYLVTREASDFFAEKHGFHIVEPSTVSAEIAASNTFKSERSGGSTAMRLDL